MKNLDTIAFIQGFHDLRKEGMISDELHDKFVNHIYENSFHPEGEYARRQIEYVKAMVIVSEISVEIKWFQIEDFWKFIAPYIQSGASVANCGD